MLFEAELAFEGVEDGLDPLSDAPEPAEAGLLVFAVGADQRCAEVLGDEPFEVAAGEAFVTEDDLPARISRWSFVSSAWVTSRSPSFGLASPRITGMPSGVLMR